MSYWVSTGKSHHTWSLVWRVPTGPSHSKVSMSFTRHRDWSLGEASRVKWPGVAESEFSRVVVQTDIKFSQSACLCVCMSVFTCMCVCVCVCAHTHSMHAFAQYMCGSRGMALVNQLFLPKKPEPTHFLRAMPTFQQFFTFSFPMVNL